MVAWGLKRVELPLRSEWGSAAGRAPSKTNLIVSVEDRGARARGEGEASLPLREAGAEGALEDAFRDSFLARAGRVDGIGGLTDVLDRADLPPALRFGIESAYVHFLADKQGRSVHQVLCLNVVTSLPTSFSVPVMDPGRLAAFHRRRGLARFGSLKVEVDPDRALDLVGEASRLHGGAVRVDANGRFGSADEALSVLRRAGSGSVEFLEQPLPPGMHEEQKELKAKSPVPLVADESLADGRVTPGLAEQFHGVNVKLMKAGGYIKALNQIKTAKELGMGVLLGCTVETGLGVFSAMNVAARADIFDLDGFLPLSRDPRPLVTEENGNILYASVH